MERSVFRNIIVFINIVSQYLNSCNTYNTAKTILV